MTDPDYIVTDNNIKILYSCLVSKYDMEEIIDELHYLYPTHTVIVNRSTYSLMTEWSTHNLLYRLHIKRDRTRDVDLNYPQKWYTKIAYTIIGTVSFLLIP